MLDLSSIAKLEKNRLESDGAWLTLLEIMIRPGLVLRVCRNTEDIQWNGETWIAFPFQLEEPKQSASSELPRFAVKVANIQRTIEGYLETERGGVGATVRLMVVMSNHLDQTEPVLDEDFSVQTTSYDQLWVTFNLSGATNFFRRIPEWRFLKNFCTFQYQGPVCCATSDLPTCDKSLKACKERNNAQRFGGEPAIPVGGLYDSRN